MPYDVQWDDEAKTIIVCTVNADFSIHRDMADALREVVILSSTVEHQVGSIMDFSRFQPSIPDNTMIYPKPQGGYSILRGDFDRSENIMDSTIDYWVAYAVKLTTPPPKIAIIVLVLNALPPTRTVTTSQTRFTTASYLDEAREMIHAHFQQGKAD